MSASTLNTPTLNTSSPNIEMKLLEKTLDEICDYVRFIKTNTDKIDKVEIGCVCQKTIHYSFDVKVYNIVRKWMDFVKNFIEEVSKIINLSNIIKKEIPDFIDMKKIVIEINEKIRILEYQRKKINEKLIEYVDERYKTKKYPVVSHDGKLDIFIG